MRRLVQTALFLMAGSSALNAQENRFELRGQFEAAQADGLTALELKALSGKAFSLASQARSASGFWGALSLVSELCEAGPFMEVRSVRAQAFQALAKRPSNSLRWSSLVTKSFLPIFSKIPREQWSAELEAFDAALDSASRGGGDRALAELAYSKAFVRVHINRRWDWLSETQRLETLRMLARLGQRFGSLPLPGASHPAAQTVGQRGQQHIYELEHLYFGAPMPAASGVNLEGQPFDLADHRGKILVIDFWTSFCQPCLALVPGVKDLLQEWSEDPVVYLGVCGDMDRQLGLSTQRRVGMTWKNLWDGPLGTAGPAAKAWNVPALGWPSVFVIDGEGRIRHKLRSKSQVEAELAPAIQALLDER